MGAKRATMSPSCPQEAERLQGKRLRRVLLLLGKLLEHPKDHPELNPLKQMLQGARTRTFLWRGVRTGSQHHLLGLQRHSTPMEPQPALQEARVTQWR